MSNFNDISSLFTKASTSLKSRISSVLYEESKLLLSEFQARAPVDTGSFRANWRIKKSRYTSANSLAGFTIYNDKDYAVYMDEGAIPGKTPWFYPGKAQTGRLAVIRGRVWAGGWNPGHALTGKGAINPVLYKNPKRQKLIAKKIAEAVIGGFK